MKFYFRQFIYHWMMTGFVGKNGRWFLGYSSKPEFISPAQLADFLLKHGAGVSFNIDLEEKNMSDELGWLVENGKSGSELMYRTMKQGNIVWTPDVNEAIRFARRKDAELFAEEDEDAWRVAEHMWMDTEPATDGTDGELSRLRAQLATKEKEIEELKENLDNLLLKVNRVTAPHRHGNTIPQKCLDDLSNLQIEVEQILKKEEE